MSKAVIFDVGGHEMAINPDHVERVQYNSPYPAPGPRSIIVTALGEKLLVDGTVQEVAQKLWP